MKSWGKKSLRFLFVSFGIVLLTSFTIDATDTLNDSQTALSIFANHMTKEKCPADMLPVSNGEKDFCIDKYEASSGPDCPKNNPTSIADTALNISDSKCTPVSEEGMEPWTYVAKPQAMQLCAKAGKRLPTAKEWYLSALGTPDNIKSCNIASGSMSAVGQWGACVSGVGAYDMIGNAWEMVEEEVVNGNIDDRILPEDGYIENVGSDGVAIETSGNPNVIYNNDYFWIKTDGVKVLMRGGFYNSKGDGGLYSAHAEVDNNFASAAIGFRCVKSL